MERGESSTSRANKEPGNPFHGITPQASASSSAVMKKGPYEEELELGDSIPDEIQEAMRTAALHIAIFSERYAESPWCLAELSYMLKTGTPILPVFYHVKPVDLRWVGKGKGPYATAFSHHKRKRRYLSSILEDWKAALERVSNLSGHVLNSTTGDEGMLLKSIVNSILRVMKKEPLEVAKHPVGMDEIVEDFEHYIESEQQVQIVGILGFGGSGKTTLATELYNRKSSSFHRFSFLHDVRDAASKNALHTKQKILLQDLHIQTASFDNVKEGKAIVSDRLKSLCTLIVLDDVDHEDQLDALLPPKQSLGSGSLVIVTTREGHVLAKWGITSIYKIKPLEDFHAKQLFCWHAFLQPSPLEGFEDLVENCIDACNGLPLSLKVIGGQLYGKRSKDYWVSQLDKFRRILPKEILERLKVSYDDLDKEDKEIFLDVACFFIGERKSTAVAVWDGSGWSGTCSWETLHNKCLVEIVETDGEECIRMHDHLRDLGREIAKTHSSRIFREDSLSRISREKRGSLNGIGATRDRRVIFNSGENDFTEEEYGELSRGLLWLGCGIRHPCDVSRFSWENMRVLEICHLESLETLWEDTRPPLQLRELEIWVAPKLQSLPTSIARLKHLKRLSLGYRRCITNIYQSCVSTLPRLSSLPEEFCQLHSLEHLVLRGCDGLSSLPSRFGDLVNLLHLDLGWCRSLKKLPKSFKQLIHLEYLNLDGCKSLESLENITNLKAIYLSKYYHTNLKAIYFSEDNQITNHASVGQLSLTFHHYLDELLPVIGQLSNLKELEINLWKSSISFPTFLGNLSSLTALRLDNCTGLHEMPSLAGLVSLNELVIKNTDDSQKIMKIEGLEHLTLLEKLVVWAHWIVPGIHGLRDTERLRTLNLKAESISAFEDCIQSIEMENWPWETTICGRLFTHAQSILDSFTFPGLAVVDSFVHPIRQWGLSCRETNLSNAAVVCYLVKCHGCCSICISEGESTSVDVGDGEWIVMYLFREVSRLVEDGGDCLHASIKVSPPYSRWSNREHQALGGRLMIGERGRVVEGFKKLFQTLCLSHLALTCSSSC
ncbi:hypothetical protein SUGI_0688450 [Cryptomeria japonica]|nr:hypothetical protein SUGI_0688450 [Cryptomeria japonica]